MAESTEIIIRRYILSDLVERRMWGGKHTEIKNLTKGLPDIFLRDHKSKKLVEKTIKKLINDSWLLAKKSTGEIHVSLNPRNTGEIKRFIEEN